MFSFKKIVSVMLALMVAMSAFAFGFTGASAAIIKDGIRYNTSSGTMTATVVNYTSHSSADEVVIPAEVDGYKVVSLGQSAFRFNTDIVSVTLPDTIETIGGYVFDDCINLTEVNINSDITSIGAAAFRNCASLDEINLGSKLQFIGAAAFKSSAVRSLDIPDTCEVIESSAFSMCQSLEEIRLPAGLTAVSEDMFSKSPALREVIIPDNVTSIGMDAFNGCEGLETVIMGEGVESVSQRAFRNCKSLVTLVLSDSITNIEANAFWDCDSLEEVNVPAGLTSLEFQAFRGCDKLTTVYFSQGIETIGARVFMNCESIRNIIIPDSVISISDTAFANCGRIVVYGTKDSEARAYSERMKYDFIGYEITSADEARITYFGCADTTEIELPSTLCGAPLTEIAPGVFKDNDKLEAIVIPANIKAVGEYAFDGCTALRSVFFEPDSTHIGRYAFANCPEIKNICLIDGIASIDECAFGYVLRDGEYVRDEEFVIYGGIYSEARRYCEENGFNFRFGQIEEVATGNIVMSVNFVEKRYEEGDLYRMINILGDVNHDYVVNVKDATEIQKHTAALLTLGDPDLILGDTNFDSRVNVKDATEIQKYTAKLIDSLYD